MELALREVTYLSVALRIVAAVLIGGLIGLERGLIWWSAWVLAW